MSGLAGWIRVWLVVTTVLCIYDAVFILNRPASLYEWSIYEGYRTWYSKMDKAYADMDYTFVISQSYLNLFECFWNVMALVTGNPSHALLYAFGASVMTFEKTVLYLVDGILGGHTTHNPPYEMFVLLSLGLIWVFVPLAVMVSIFRTVCRRMDAAGKCN